MYHASSLRAPHLLIALAIGFVLLLAACGGDDDSGDDNGYPPEVRQNFLDSCTNAGSTEDGCKCAWDKITDRYSYDEFVEIEESLSTGSGGEELIPIIEECFLAT